MGEYQGDCSEQGQKREKRFGHTTYATSAGPKRTDTTMISSRVKAFESLNGLYSLTAVREPGESIVQIQGLPLIAFLITQSGP